MILLHILKKYTTLVFVIFSVTTTQAFNSSYFYRASSFWDEPRFERQLLSTFAVELTGGSTCISRDNCGRKVPLLSILSEKQNLTDGRIDVFEIDSHYTQNFCGGIFTEISVPFTVVQIRPSFKGTCHECSAQCSQEHTSLCSTAITSQCRRTQLIDSTALIGWTYNNENTTVLDFIDTTLKAGALLPTSNRPCTNNPLGIPLGYNNTWGIVGSATLSAGMYDWLTAGIHADGIIFPKKNRSIGNVWRIGAYGKADHIYKGLSFSLAFTYEQQNKLSKHNCTSKSLAIPLIKGWSRSLVHLLIEYDFIRYECSCYPTISLIYNRHLTGKRVFQTNTLGAYLACSLSWCF
ncbi:hypothetical protein H0X48_03375 [Candidatus Dependentiae bacterium]|nr:hypothetical protein [Candidatus Dependentiae bacterium]